MAESLYMGKTLKELALSTLGIEAGVSPSLESLFGEEKAGTLAERIRTGLGQRSRQLGTLGRDRMDLDNPITKRIRELGEKTQEQVVGSLGMIEMQETVDKGIADEKERQRQAELEARMKANQSTDYKDRNRS